MIGLRRLRVRPSAALLILALPAIAMPARGERPAACEPGFSSRDGSWILPVLVPDPSPPDTIRADGGFEVWLEDRRLPAPEVLTYAPGIGGQPLAAIVLFDALRGEDGRPVSPVPWANALRRHLVGAGIVTASGCCAVSAAEIRRPGDAEVVVWPTEGSGWPEAGARLWDGVLEAITVLSEMEEPDRRLLLLVSDGREESVSEHVLASCLDAAARARVPIYVLGVAAGANREAEEARLLDLAQRSGGQFVADAGGPAGSGAEAAVTAICGRLAAVRGLRIAPTADPLPVTVTVGLVGAGARDLRGVIAPRQRLRPPGIRRWYALGGGLLAATGAAAVLWRHRNAIVGELLLTTRDGVRRVPIPRDGLTIGSDRGNRLRLANRTVSRQHAVIHWREGHLVLTDLRSTRGTAVNGKPVVAHRLTSGDRILVGREVELEFRQTRSHGRRRA